MPADIDRWAGYYRSVTPRNEYGRYIERLDVDRIRRVDDRLIVSRLFASDIEFYPVAGRAFKRRSRPMTTLALVQGPDGEKYTQGERGNRRKVSAAVVWFERAAVGLVALLLLSGPAWALVWVPLKLLGNLKGRPVAVRIWPLTAIAALPAAVAVLGVGAGDIVDRLGKPSAAGVGFVAFSWLFALLAAWGLICALRSDPRQVGRFARGALGGGCVGLPDRGDLLVVVPRYRFSAMAVGSRLGVRGALPVVLLAGLHSPLPADTVVEDKIPGLAFSSTSPATSSTVGSAFIYRNPKLPQRTFR